MKKSFFFIFTFLFLSTFLYGQTYRIGTDKQTEPFFPIVKEVYQEAGFSAEVVVEPGGRSLVNANAGNLDGEALRVFNIDEKFPNLVKVPTALTNIVLAAYTLKDARPVNSPADLAGRKVAIFRGFQAAEGLVERAGAQVLTVTDSEALLKMLISGRAEVVVQTVDLMIPFLSKYPKVVMQPKPLLVIPLHTWVHRSHEAIVPKLDEVIKGWGPEGVIQRVQALQ